MNHKNKSKIKASGFKSAFIVGDRVITTSFGKGSSAILEKEVADDVVREINTNDSNYTLEITSGKKYAQKKYSIKGKWLKKDVTGDDPREYSIMRDDNGERIGMDVIRIKDKIEEEIFGRAFPEDNIHIQLAYNILDIKKMLAVYVNNIVYSLNNLAHRSNRIPSEDMLGNILASITIDEFNGKHDKRSGKTKAFITELLKYKKYLPEAFSAEVSESKKGANVRKWQSDDDIYTLLRILSDVRQSCVHGYNFIFNYDDKDCDAEHLAEKRTYLNNRYEEKIKRVNGNFFKFNAVDLFILFKLYYADTCEDKSELARLYYDFVVVQKSKNLGFSIKEIRELIIEKHLGRLKEKGYDSVRGRLYRLIDFILYRYYTAPKNSVAAENFVNRLRASLSDEEHSGLYNEQCDSAFRVLNKKFSSLASYVNSQKIGGYVEKAKKYKPEIDTSKLNRINAEASYFVKILYVLTLFLDGKEINELISTLISKFDNIASFVSVLEECGIPCEFENDYKLFASSSSISEELRTLKSFARMKIEISEPSDMYNDAVCILGLKDKNGRLILEYSDELNAYLDDYVKDKLRVSPKQKDASAVAEKKDTNLRNFLINNVITSRRFWYVIRYINPRSARRIMNNGEIVRFVLERLPDEQIRRNYISVSGLSADETDKAEQIKFLCEKITGMNINYFENVPQRDKKENVIKERCKAVIGLYLTVLYLFTKNLVKVNSRYTIACCCLERDSKLHGLIEYNKNGDPDYEKFCEKLIEKALDEKWINKRYRGYFKAAEKNKEAGSDRKHYNKQLHKSFRNAIVHLNAVMDADKYIDGIKNIDSYFMIYHYIMQRYLSNGKPQGWLGNSPAEKQLETAKQCRTYSKNVVKGLCLPFGYNLSRFKNLTVMEVFNRQEIMEESRKKEAAEN